MNTKNKKKLLVIRFSALGDVAMIAPVLKEFLEQNPDVELYVASRPFMKAIFSQFSEIKFIPIDFATEYKGFFNLFKLYRDLKRYNFDYVADFHNVIRSKIITFLFKLSGVKTSTIDKGRKEKKSLVDQKNKVLKQLKLTTERYADVLRKLGFQLILSHQLKPIALKEEKTIGIAPFAAFKSKMYPLDNMKIIAQNLSKQGYKVFLFGGGKKEIEELKAWENLHPNIKSLAGNFTFEQELQKIARLEALIAMDSANMHLASLMGTRVISLWGGTHPFAGFTGYGQANEDVIQDNTLVCRPTSIYGKSPKEFENFDYFQNLNPEEIYKIILKKLS